MVTVGSLFSGVGGFEAGFAQAGFDIRWQCEIDAACKDVLRHRFPETEVLYDDIRTVNWREAEPVDLICGGFPCQDLSVAGDRAGLDGARSGLWFEYHRVLRELRPAWCVIENVPGLLSSCGCATCRAVRRLRRIHSWIRQKRGIDQPCAVCLAGERLLASHRGRDFALILSGLVELGYGVSWRILDAQYYGVPQRRRRLFLVGHLGDGRAAEVLFEPTCVPGNPPPRREAGERTAARLADSTGERGWCNDLDRNGAFIETARMTAFGEYTADDHASAIKARDYKDATDLIAHAVSARAHASHREDSDTYITHSLHDMKHGVSEDGTGRGVPLVTHSLTGGEPDASSSGVCRVPQRDGHMQTPEEEDGTGRGTPLIAVRTAQTGSNGWGVNEEETSYTLDGAQGQAVAFGISNDPTPKYADGVMPPLQSKERGGGRMDAVAFGIDSQRNVTAQGMGPLTTTGSSREQAVAFGVADDTAYRLRANASHSGDKGDGGINTTMVASLDLRGLRGGDDRAVTLQPEMTHSLATGGGSQDAGGRILAPMVAVPEVAGTLKNPGAGGRTTDVDVPNYLPTAMGVRRLTPTECERLQGWPDDHTRYGASGREMADSVRYRMAGNGVATPVAAWIARRIRAAMIDG